MATYEQVKSALAELPHKEMVLATCAIVREQAWRFIQDDRSKKVVEAAEGYVNGTVTLEELREARAAAYSASYSTAASYAAPYTSYASCVSCAADAASYAASSASCDSYAASRASYALDAASYASDKRSELRDRQLEIISDWKKKSEGKSGKDLTLIEHLEKALALAKGNQ